MCVGVGGGCVCVGGGGGGGGRGGAAVGAGGGGSGACLELPAVPCAFGPPTTLEPPRCPCCPRCAGPGARPHAAGPERGGTGGHQDAGGRADCGGAGVQGRTTLVLCWQFRRRAWQRRPAAGVLAGKLQTRHAGYCKPRREGESVRPCAGWVACLASSPLPNAPSQISLQFTCQQINCTRDSFGNVVDGKPDEVHRCARDATWRLPCAAAGVVAGSPYPPPPRCRRPCHAAAR